MLPSSDCRSVGHVSPSLSAVTAMQQRQRAGHRCRRIANEQASRIGFVVKSLLECRLDFFPTLLLVFPAVFLPQTPIGLQLSFENRKPLDGSPRYSSRSLVDLDSCVDRVRISLRKCKGWPSSHDGRCDSGGKGEEIAATCVGSLSHWAHLWFAGAEVDASPRLAFKVHLYS